MIIPIEQYEELIKPVLECEKLRRRRLESAACYWEVRCKHAEYEAETPEDYFLNELQYDRQGNTIR